MSSEKPFSIPVGLIARFLLPAIVLLAGCDLVGGSGSDPARLSLSIHIPGVNSVGAAAKGAAGYVLTDGVNTLDIESVGIVLREVELKKATELDCDDAENDGSDDDGCEEIETGPVLLEPVLDGSTRHVVTVDIGDGVFDELEFKVHKVTGDSAESLAFLNEHPEFEDLSIRAAGTFNGNPFVFEQDLMDEQEIELDPPITVDGGSQDFKITMDIDLSTWFVDPSGNLLDPASANRGEPNEPLVEGNIKRSIDAFEDDDEDGEHDDDEGGDD